MILIFVATNICDFPVHLSQNTIHVLVDEYWYFFLYNGRLLSECYQIYNFDLSASQILWLVKFLIFSFALEVFCKRSVVRLNLFAIACAWDPECVKICRIMNKETSIQTVSWMYTYFWYSAFFRYKSKFQVSIVDRSVDLTSYFYLVFFFFRFSISSLFDYKELIKTNNFFSPKDFCEH